MLDAYNPAAKIGGNAGPGGKTFLKGITAAIEARNNFFRRASTTTNDRNVLPADLKEWQPLS